MTYHIQATTQATSLTEAINILKNPDIPSIPRRILHHYTLTEKLAKIWNSLQHYQSTANTLKRFHNAELFQKKQLLCANYTQQIITIATQTNIEQINILQQLIHCTVRAMIIITLLNQHANQKKHATSGRLYRFINTFYHLFNQLLESQGLELTEQIEQDDQALEALPGSNHTTQIQEITLLGALSQITHLSARTTDHIKTHWLQLSHYLQYTDERLKGFTSSFYDQALTEKKRTLCHLFLRSTRLLATHYTHHLPILNKNEQDLSNYLLVTLCDLIDLCITYKASLIHLNQQARKSASNGLLFNYLSQFFNDLINIIHSLDAQLLHPIPNLLTHPIGNNQANQLIQAQNAQHQQDLARVKHSTNALSQKYQDHTEANEAAISVLGDALKSQATQNSTHLSTIQQQHTEALTELRSQLEEQTQQNKVLIVKTTQLARTQKTLSTQEDGQKANLVALHNKTEKLSQQLNLRGKTLQTSQAEIVRLSTTLASVQQTHRQEITALQSQHATAITDKDSRIATLSTQIDTQQADHLATQTQLTAAENTIKQQKGSLAQVQTELHKKTEELSQSKSTITTSIERTQAELTKAHQTETLALQDRLTLEHVAEIDLLSARHATEMNELKKEQKAHIEQYTTQAIAAHEANITELQAQLATLETATSSRNEIIIKHINTLRAALSSTIETRLINSIVRVECSNLVTKSIDTMLIS